MAELNLDRVVEILKEKGVDACVEQTGGGVATIYAGEQKRREWDDKWERWDACAGPGWFAGPGWTNGRGDTSDFAVGPDDDGQADPLYAKANWNEARVAFELLVLCGKV